MTKVIFQQPDDFKPLTTKEAAEVQIHQLQKAGKSRSIKEIEKQIELARTINDRVLKEIPDAQDGQQSELRRVAKQLIREIKAFDHFRLELEPRKSEIWVGKILTRLLFVAAKTLSSKAQKQLAHAIEKAEKALSNSPDDTALLNNHLTIITELRKKASPGVIFDLSTLCQSRLAFHIGYAGGENPYLKLSKLDQAEALLEESQTPQKNYRQLEDVRLADFRKELETNLEPIPIEVGTPEVTIDKITEQIGVATVKNDTLFLGKLIDQFKQHPLILASVDLKLDQYPFIKAAVEKLPIWKEAHEFRALANAGFGEEKRAEYHRLMQLGAPLNQEFWEKLKELQPTQREAIFKIFPSKKDQIFEVATRLSQLPPEENVALLASALPMVEKLLNKSEGSLTTPFVTQFSDAQADKWRQNRSVDIVQYQGSPQPLEREIHIKALERLSQHILDDFKTSLSAIKKTNVEKTGSNSSQWFSKATQMMERDMPLLQALQQTGGVKGIDSVIKTYTDLVEHQKIFSQLSEKSIQAEVAVFSERLAQVKTYDELVQLERDITTKNTFSKLDNEIRVLQESDPDLAVVVRREIGSASVVREGLTKGLLETINHQKAAISTIRMVSRNLQRETPKVSLSQIKKGYQSLLTETDPKSILENGIKLERQAVAYLTENKNDKTLENLRSQARQKVSEAGVTLMKTAKTEESQKQVLALYDGLGW